jgi:hypothetical protein
MLDCVSEARVDMLIDLDRTEGLSVAAPAPVAALFSMPARTTATLVQYMPLKIVRPVVELFRAVLALHGILGACALAKKFELNSVGSKGSPNLLARSTLCFCSV